MQYSDTANASFWTISSRIMATMSTFIINCTTKHQQKVEEVAPEESSIYWWKTSEISHFTFLCLNHRSFIRIFSNCRFLDQTWPCFNLHVTDPLRTVTEMSEALAEPCKTSIKAWNGASTSTGNISPIPMSQECAGFALVRSMRSYSILDDQN